LRSRIARSRGRPILPQLEPEHPQRSILPADPVVRFIALLVERPYLLGRSPSIADFGMMGPMLRHFGQDPTPAEIMRNEAPAVYAWVARVWNAGAAAPRTPDLLDEVPTEAAPLLREIAETHLVQLAANATAHAAGAKHFEMVVQGCSYRKLPVSRSRVSCLERLREQFSTLSREEQERVRALVPQPEAEVVWHDRIPARSGYDPERAAPFNRAINVFGRGTPR
jgi:hypothetical protein